MTVVDTSDISAQLFVTVMFFLLIIAPLISLGVLRLFQGKRKAGFGLIGGGVCSYFVFHLIASIIS